MSWLEEAEKAAQVARAMLRRCTYCGHAQKLHRQGVAGTQVGGCRLCGCVLFPAEVAFAASYTRK